MSECDRCGLSDPDCQCHVWELEERISFLEKTIRQRENASLKIPEYIPTFEEIAKQMRINADVIMAEITHHINKEMEEFDKENFLAIVSKAYDLYEEQWQKMKK